MASLALMLFTEPEALEAQALFAFLTISAVALFAIFLPLVTWIDKRHKERVAFYKAETLRRITEASSEGAKAAIDLLREESRLERQKRREGLKIGGLVCIGVGLAMLIFLKAMPSTEPGAYLVGLVPGFTGIALLVYVFFWAAPVE
ncbi:MAG: DUF6249 domain-containing protein [Terracidiphilus sp.]